MTKNQYNTKTNTNKQQVLSNIVDNRGQALLFVIVAMTIALTVGVAITSQTMSSLKTTSTTDTSSRVYAAAEGGIEWFLRQPVTVLDKLADGDNNGGADCPAGTTGTVGNPAACTISYQPQNGDNIHAKADITIQRFSVNYVSGSNDNYWFTLDPGSVKEVALKDYVTGSYYTGGLNVCWKSLDAANSSGIYYLTYDSTGILTKKIISPAAVTGTYNVQGDVSAGTGKLEYDNCYTITISSNTNGIRFKSLYAPSKIAVFPTSGGFSTQGFKITAVGELDNVAEKAKATKQIVVYRSLPYAPSAFDYSIYSNNPIN